MQKKPHPELLHDLIKTGRRYKLPKGQIIQSSDGRKVFTLITEGYVKRYIISNEGSLRIQSIYGPGDAYPLTLAFKSLFNQELYTGPEVVYYETMSGVEIYSIDEQTLVDAVHKDKNLYRDLLLEAGNRFHSNIQQLENFSLNSSYKKVAHQLAYFAAQFGSTSKEGTSIDLLLTHEDLANVISATRETVSTCMIKLRKKGLIKTGKNIIVPDVKKLQDEAFG